MAVEDGAEDFKEDKEGRGTASLEDMERKWLDPLTQIPFVPWVNDETIHRGALAEIQRLMEKGDDPETVGTRGEDDRGETMEVGKSEDEVVKEGGLSAEGESAAQRREEKPKVFGGLDLYVHGSGDEDED